MASLISGIFYNNITTYRLTATVGIQKSYQKNLTNQPCLIQPITPEYAQKTGMDFDRSYFCQTDIGVDIQTTDRVIDQDGKSYQVSGSRKGNFGMTTQHVTYLLSEEAQASPDV
jgi:hypothetical protein